MLVGIFSDTHDNVTWINRAIELFGRRRVELVLHAGDICSPFAARAIKSVDVPLHIILGNNEGETKGLKQIFPQLVKGPIEIEVDHLRIVMAHDFSWIPSDLRARADVLVAGHTHKPVTETNGGALWINPGECCGWVNGRKTVAILDTATMKAEIIDL